MDREWRVTPWTCTRCGECCTTTPYVVVSEQERALLDERRRGLAWQPDDKPGFWRLLAGPCPFYDEGCTVYDVRPLNCRRFASLKGFTGNERAAMRQRVLIQRRAHAKWGHQHGWQP